MDGGVLRRACDDDLDVVVALAGQFCELAQRAFDPRRAAGALEPLLTDDALGQVWLVHDPESVGEPVGYAVLTWGWSVASGGRECRLDELHVRARGNGLAARALGELIEHAEAAGATKVLLETEAHDRPTREFFGAAGFDLTDSVWMDTWLD